MAKKPKKQAAKNQSVTALDLPNAEPTPAIAAYFAKCLEKLGFVREGTLREDCVVNGEVSDSWVYGLIRRDWRPAPEPIDAGAAQN